MTAGAGDGVIPTTAQVWHDGMLYLVGLRASAVVCLDETAALIWRLLREDGDAEAELLVRWPELTPGQARDAVERVRAAIEVAGIAAGR